MKRTVIIGAGLAGLATAALLAKEGHAVVVLEKNDTVGGRVGVIERDGFRFDIGPSWYLMPGVMEHYFELLGTTTKEQFDLVPLNPSYRVYGEPNGVGKPEPVTIPRDAARVRRTFEAIERGSGRALEAYLKSARHTTDMAIRYFLYNPFTRLHTLMARDIVGRIPTLVRLLSTTLDSYIAKRFTHPLLRQILGYHAVFIGTNPADAPAMYHLMSTLDLDEGVDYPVGGFGVLPQRLEALAREAGVQIITGAEAVHIATKPSGKGRRRRAVRGVIWKDSTGTERRIEADIVVSNADLHHTETQLLRPVDRSYPEGWWRRRTNGPSAVIALLGVKGELPELLHHSLFFTRDWPANFAAIFGPNMKMPDPASIYVCRSSATDPATAPPGHENLFVLIPCPPDPSIGAGGPDGTGDDKVEKAADRAIEQIAQWANIPDLADRIVSRHTIGPRDYLTLYHAWQGGMLGPAHILSQSALFRAQNASKKVRGLYYAGATTAPGIGVPMCLISAEIVLKRIRGDHSPGPLPTIRSE